jgi:DNA-directed RNA polymerase specialized sigma24 family protein
VSIDDLAGDVPASDPEVDALFEREWARSVLAQALERLRAECDAAGRASTYAVFVDYDVDGAQAGDGRSYADVAARHGLPVTQVTNYLNWARRRFRAHTLDTLRALTASDAEFRDEARALLGVTIP